MTDDQSVLTTAERLGEFNDDLVAPFRVLEKTLKPVVREHEWASFQNALIALTGAGWHSWEATAIALRIAPTVHERLGYAQLQRSLDLSCRLADRSFKTSVADLFLQFRAHPRLNERQVNDAEREKMMWEVRLKEAEARACTQQQENRI
ncbi:MAG: hypothetical protein AAF525_23030, partial [Pseudomonadota bacterium]